MHAAVIAVLLESEDITQEQLDRATQEANELQTSVEAVLVRRGLLTELRLIQAALVTQGLSPLEPYESKSAWANSLPEHLARRFQMLPLYESQTQVTVGMANPQNADALDAVHWYTGLRVQGSIAPSETVARGIELAYSVAPQLPRGDDWAAFRDEVVHMRAPSPPEGPRRDTSRSPVPRFVDLLLEEARTCGASHIHIESDIRIRFRVGHELHERPAPPWFVYHDLIARLKVMAGLTGVARQGQFGAIRRDEDVIGYLSTCPTLRGERAVLHLRDPSTDPVRTWLELPAATCQALLRLLSIETGWIVLAGGPRTGQSTWAQALIHHFRPRRAVLVLDDPVCSLAPQGALDAGRDPAETRQSLDLQDLDVLVLAEGEDPWHLDLARSMVRRGKLVISLVTQPPPDATAVIGLDHTAQSTVRLEVPRPAASAVPGGDPVWLNWFKTPDWRLKEIVDEATVVRVVNLILSEAIGHRVSQIHFDPPGRVRMRENGRLSEMMSVPQHIHEAIMVRLKVMAGDLGVIHLRHDDRAWNLRLGACPTSTGERAVLHLIAAAETVQVPGDLQQRVERWIADRQGWILIAGADRSGRTSLMRSLVIPMQANASVLALRCSGGDDLSPVPTVPFHPASGFVGRAVRQTLLQQDVDVVVLPRGQEEESLHAACGALRRGRIAISVMDAPDREAAVDLIRSTGESHRVKGVITVRVLRTDRGREFQAEVWDKAESAIFTCSKQPSG